MEENVVITYNVFHGGSLGLPIAIYFYMTGLSAGSFILSTMAYGFGMASYKPIAKPGIILAILLLALGPVMLIIDLGQPLRFWHLFPYLNLASPITWGTFLLMAYPLNGVIYAWFMFSGNLKLTRLFGMVGIPLAISVHGYTGFILALGKARALWNTALMPMYFLVSAMVSGIALMILVVLIQGRLSPERKVNRELAYSLGKMLAMTILVDLFLVISDVLVLLTADVEAREAAQLILFGSFRPYFVWVELVLGSFLPLGLLFFPPTGRRLSTVVLAAVLAMIGVFAMRYVMVIGGQAVPLS